MVAMATDTSFRVRATIGFVCTVLGTAHTALFRPIRYRAGTNIRTTRFLPLRNGTTIIRIGKKFGLCCGGDHELPQSREGLIRCSLNG